MTHNQQLRQYAIVTGNYWAFTLTDGALRMLIVLHFHQLGYSPLQVAALFLFYELFGVVTNLVGGYLGARMGLNRTMNTGLFMQVIALAMLAVPTPMLSVAWVMSAQALSGIAKDLNKMSAKSSLKLLVPKDQQAQLFGWVSLLTGSKNALKGVGFFLGAALLSLLSFKGAVIAMALLLAVIFVLSTVFLKTDLGKAKTKPKFNELFSKSRAINTLSAARLLLFGARDIWFVVALPVFLSTQLQWSFWWVGGFMASWIIGYGIVQSLVPRFLRSRTVGGDNVVAVKRLPDGKSTVVWAFALAGTTALIPFAMDAFHSASTIIILGLIVFGILFAINSSIHSYLIVSYAKEDGVSLDVGFYYMANAMGRLIGTLLSGWIFQAAGLAMCLWVSAGFIFVAALVSLNLPRAVQK